MKTIALSLLVGSGVLLGIDVPAEAWRVSPWNPIAYSALVIVLGYIAWKRDKKADTLEEELRKQSERHRLQIEQWTEDYLAGQNKKPDSRQ